MSFVAEIWRKTRQRLMPQMEKPKRNENLNGRLFVDCIYPVSTVNIGRIILGIFDFSSNRLALKNNAAGYRTPYVTF